MIDLLLPVKWVTKTIEDKLLWCQQHLKGNAVFLPFPNSDTWPMGAKPAAHFCFPLKPLPQQLPPRTPIILHLLLLITKVSQNFLKSENFEKTKFLQHKFCYFQQPSIVTPLLPPLHSEEPNIAEIPPRLSGHPGKPIIPQFWPGLAAHLPIQTAQIWAVMGSPWAVPAQHWEKMDP